MTKPFDGDYEHDDLKPLQAILVNSKTSRSSKEIKKLRISLTNLKGDLIDTYESEPDKLWFKVEPAPFLTQSLEIDEDQTYTDSIFNFAVKTSVPLISSDYLEVLPPA
jgi:hypothetical protein